MVMKRNSDIDSPRRNKRTSEGLDVLHMVNIDRYSSENERRAREHLPDTRTFKRKSERSSNVHTVKKEFGVDSYKGKRTEIVNEASIRVSNFTRSAADHVLREKLVYEFKKFGEISVRIVRHDDERYAVVYFRNSDDAVEAKRSIENRGRAIFLQDRALNLQFSIPSSQLRRFTPDVFHQKGRFSRGSPTRSKRDELALAQEKHRTTKGERFFCDESTISSAALAHEGDDPKATRTLFVGNLESSISRQDVRRQFERYGVVEDVDIKRPIRGQGSTYAFVKFIDLDVATKAKVAMQGSFFGRNQVKIGYGKSMPTTRLWIGGLGSWTSIVELEREFDRFGAIRRIDYNKGHDHAFILYDSLDAASVAAREMRGFQLNGRRLKIDFAELTQGFEEYPDTLGHLVEDRENQFTTPQKTSGESLKKSPDEKVFKRERNNSDGSGKLSDSVSNYTGGKHESWQGIDEKKPKQKSEERPKYRGPRTPSPPENAKPSARNHRSKNRAKSGEKHKSGNRVSRSQSPPAKRPRKTSGPPPALSPQRFGSVSPKRQSFSASPVSDVNHTDDKSSKEKDQERNQHKNEETKEKIQDNENIESEKPTSESKEIVPVEESISSTSESLQDIAKRFAVAWRGSLILKSSSFPVRLHLIGGNPEIVEVLLRNIPGNSAPNTVLRISQRLRLDQPKLEEVSKRMNTAGASGYCMLLALPGVHGGELPLDTETNMPTQQRPLRNLVTYLKQKQAAGVVNLISTNSLSSTNLKDEGGVLHAFPPCQYSHDQLLKIAPHLGQEAFNEDHLLVVVIRGTA
jgi:RNA-binding protein 15